MDTDGCRNERRLGVWERGNKHLTRHLTVILRQPYADTLTDRLGVGLGVGLGVSYPFEQHLMPSNTDNHRLPYFII